MFLKLSFIHFLFKLFILSRMEECINYEVLKTKKKYREAIDVITTGSYIHIYIYNIPLYYFV